MLQTRGKVWERKGEKGKQYRSGRFSVKEKQMVCKGRRKVVERSPQLHHLSKQSELDAKGNLKYLEVWAVSVKL